MGVVLYTSMWDYDPNCEKEKIEKWINSPSKKANNIYQVEDKVKRGEVLDPDDFDVLNVDSYRAIRILQKNQENIKNAENNRIKNKLMNAELVTDDEADRVMSMEITVDEADAIESKLITSIKGMDANIILNDNDQTVQEKWEFLLLWLDFKTDKIKKVVEKSFSPVEVSREHTVVEEIQNVSDEIEDELYLALMELDKGRINFLITGDIIDKTKKTSIEKNICTTRRAIEIS